jgi:saccharopine dehydrogenase-like NADP-dependent oxidoreductase
VILGGAGAVGMRIARLLTQRPDEEMLIVGRDFGRSTQSADELAESGVSARPVVGDDLRALLARERPALLIDASGPFRGRDLSVPRACIDAGVPYLDLAADPEFVMSVRVLNAAALAAGVPVLTGAGITPCVTLAAVDAVAASMTKIEAVRVVLCPGNQQPFGTASYASLLSRTGKSFRWRRNGRRRTTHGWQDRREAILPEIGRRAISAVETPDVALLLERWPSLREATVHAGLELAALQKSLWLLSWFGRVGFNLAHATVPLEAMARTLGHLGSRRYVLRVSVEGRSGIDRVERSWTLLAEDGGHLAAAAAMVLARRILRGPPPAPGARVASVTLPELRGELRRTGFDIRMNETVL